MIMSKTHFLRWVVTCLVLLGAMFINSAWAQVGAKAFPKTDGQSIVLLSTYVVSPARLSKLVAAAAQAGVPLKTLSAEDDSLDKVQQTLRNASLVILDAPHSSVAPSFGPSSM